MSTPETRRNETVPTPGTDNAAAVAAAIAINAAGRENLRLATLGVLEWVYDGDDGSNTIKIPGVATLATKNTADDIICRVQRDPNSSVTSRAITDAAPVWRVSVFSIPAKGDDDSPPFTRDFNGTGAGKEGNGTIEEYLMNGSALNGDRARTSRCWTFEEAVEAAARLANDLTDND